MAAPKGTAARGIEWARRNRGAGMNRIMKWTHEAGFGEEVEWCGVFLGAMLRSQGIKPPKGYPLAINWAKYGTKVPSLRQARPGDIIVYPNHVQMYLGHGQAIQGNDENNTVGVSGTLPGIVAIRRPPWKGARDGLSAFERSLVAQGKSPKEAHQQRESEDLGEGGLGLPFEGGIPNPLSPLEDLEHLAAAIVGALENPESFLLTAGLLGGGAFLVYYGAAQLLGVRRPVAAPAGAAVKVASIA
jgi:hypothetical protein